MIQIPKKRNPPSKQTIERLIGEGKTVTEIAKKYGFSRQRIYQIMKQQDNANHPDGVREVGNGEHRLVDPKTGMVVENRGSTSVIIGKIGDEKVSEFVAYHLAMLEMRQGVNKRDVNDLRARFYNYLKYCVEHSIMPNNMNGYFAMGVTKQEMSAWRLGNAGTPEHAQFAEEVTSLFASIHEQAGAESMINPILAIWWQKSHDGMIEAQKLEVQVEDPLGQKQTAAEIAAKYANVDLPD